MTTIITKNSSTASAAPVAGDLTKGELAVNVTDKKLYTKDNGGSVVKLVGSLGNQEANAVAVTGGAIDGTPIGGTTASTASFTTVSASGNVTLSGGTANGVLYLNGSKVATSGSALTYNGTSLGVGTNSPDAGVAGYSSKASFDGTNPAINLRNASGSNSNWQIGTAGSGGGWLSFYDAVNSTEQMRLTSIGLGIGTSSPQAKLELGGTNPNMYFGPVATGSGAYLSYNTAGNYFAINAVTQGVGYRNIALANDGGSVGIGTSSPAYKLDVVGAINASAANPTGFNHALRTTGVTTGRSQIYLNNTSGDLVLGVEGSSGGTSYSGTAAYSSFAATSGANPFYVITNSAIRATFDSSGNFGLGVAPSAWGAASQAFQNGGGSFFQYNNDRVFIGQNTYITSAFGDAFVGNGYATRYRQYAGTHAFFVSTASNSSGAGAAATFSQALTLDASGNLLVGQTAVGNGGKLAVNGSISICTSTTGTQSSMAKDATQLTTSISTSATTIYTDISSGMSSASAGYFIIYGNNNGGAGFMDVVIAKANGTPVVVSSSTIEGSPAARTYSVSSFALKLAMASGTYNVNLKATVIGFPF